MTGTTDTPPREPARHPALPHGEHVELPGRGTTFVRRLTGPEGAPTVLLLHGWTASIDLNFFTCYRKLARHFHVVALDHRGHGQGIRSRRAFRLEDCADDAVALLDVLGIEQAIPVGYSMGGAVASLVWKRHRPRTEALVLCATAPFFHHTRQERLGFLSLGGLAAMARLTPAQSRRWLTERFYLHRKRDQWEAWAVEEAARHDWRMVLEAGRAIGRFDARPWMGEIDVPTSVVVTMRDSVVPTHRQVKWFEGIPEAEALRVDGDHDVIIAHADRFVPMLVRAIESAHERAVAQ